jgi:hypothetical protein
VLSILTTTKTSSKEFQDALVDQAPTWITPKVLPELQHFSSVILNCWDAQMKYFTSVVQNLGVTFASP